jgi:hypothetical protein
MNPDLTFAVSGLSKGRTERLITSLLSACLGFMVATVVWLAAFWVLFLM